MTAQSLLGGLLNNLMWLVTAAGVFGLLIVGVRMAISLRSGEGQEHLSQFATVIGACLVAASAGPVVELLLSDG